MTIKTCARKGCEEAAKHKAGNSVYCDKHYIQVTRARYAKTKNKYAPSIEEFDNLWENLIKNNFKCPVCDQKIIIKASIEGPRGNIISLQHWNDGRIELICHSCNVEHGNSKLGDNWRGIPKGQKYCPQCSELKSIQDFYKNASNLTDCLDSKCKACSKKCCRKYKKENKEKISNSSKEYRDKNKDKIKKYKKAYREKNKEKIKTYREKNKDKAKAYQKENKEKLKIYKKAWYEKNKKKR